MLNTQLIGSFISSLRKEWDFTQVELADKVNVSHQAVSKWERGESIPDIGTLVELSRIFDTSVDRILEGGENGRARIGGVVEKLAINEPAAAADLINQGESDLESFVSIAPIVKGSLMEKVISEVDGEKFSLQHLIGLAPFLEKETFTQAAEKMHIENVTWKQIRSLAPFVEEMLLQRLVANSESSPSIKDVISLAPFIRTGLDDLVNTVEVDEVSFEHVKLLAPFLSEDGLFAFIEKTAQEGITLQQFTLIAPFLGKNNHAVAAGLDVNGADGSDVVKIAPFVNRETLGSLLDRLDKQSVRVEHLVKLAPFLEKAKLSELVIKAMETEEVDPVHRARLSPFMQPK
ncbi:helix-turn-helix transcriptional regulator [Sutcliffiella sp. NPDC057660]|uniref:helix-turn-helix transcriptional regulator n=1 Tax=Sutcliffiella sp. NPDC057660 TaxID=3346199 RepID=UPI00367DB87B